MEDVHLDTRNLDALIKAMKENLSRARIGILGSKTVRNNVKTSGGKYINAVSNKLPSTKINFSTNAAIGAIHEFGGSKMPMRSFLRMPITEYLQKRMESSGAFDKDSMNEVLKQKSVVPWLKKIATIAEAIVVEAFETGGFGKWPAWKTPGYSNDDNRLLVDTRQLRESISSEVK